MSFLKKKKKTENRRAEKILHEGLVPVGGERI
jgi:hypothetical protein